MRDDDERTAACIECREHTLNQARTTLCIQSCCGFIEEEQRGLGGKRECSEKAAALSAREPCGICPQRFIQSRRKCPHHIGKLCRLKCLPHPLLVHIRMQTQKVIARRCAEEITSLHGSSKEGA